MLCHSVRSVRSPDPLSVQPSSVAIENRQNGVPLAVYFSSGSRPSRPTRITLLIDFPITCSPDLVPPLRLGQSLQVLCCIRCFLGAGTLFANGLQYGLGLGNLLQSNEGPAFLIKGRTLFITGRVLRQNEVEFVRGLLKFLLSHERIANVV